MAASMLANTSPSRSEPIPATPSNNRASVHQDVTKSMTPQKRKASLFSSSPALTYSDSAEYGSTPLTPSQSGVSSFNGRLQRTLDTPFPSSPPEPTTYRQDDTCEPETPSKRCKRSDAGAPLGAEAVPCLDLQEGERRSMASNDKVSLEKLLSNLSTNTPAAKRVRYYKDSTPAREEAQPDGEDPFASSSTDRPRYRWLNASSPDFDELTNSDKENVPEQTDGRITAENAQSILLPQACVFAANLPKVESDEAITEALEEAFSPFGPCWVKVLRSHSDQMPYAFVQYKTSEEAHNAVEQGRGVNILGRPCRTEVARAHRAVYVTRRNGLRPSRAEIFQLLEPFGELEAVAFPTETDIHMHDLQPGGWARFRIFGDCKDAISQLQSSALYHVRQAKELNPKKQLFQNDGYHDHPRINFKRLQQVRVRWLPSDIKESQIRDHFKTYGRINCIDLRASYPGSGPNVEGLITFNDWREAENAINGEDNLVIVDGGVKRRLRVDFAVVESNEPHIKSGPGLSLQAYDTGAAGFNAHPSMSPIPMLPGPVLTPWLSSMPDGSVFWHSQPGGPQVYQPHVHGVASGQQMPHVQMPFYGVPLQYYPGHRFGGYGQQGNAIQDGADSKSPTKNEHNDPKFRNAHSANDPVTENKLASIDHGAAAEAQTAQTAQQIPMIPYNNLGIARSACTMLQNYYAPSSRTSFQS